ncbi:MAG: TolC family protein, partial [Candidatus Zixiibacteriota bacterium]
PLFAKERLNTEIEQSQRLSLTGAEDWTVSSSAGFSHLEPSIAFLGPERTDAFQVGAGLDRVFWNTGGRFSATLQASRVSLNIDPTLRFPDSYYENKLELTYSHPLLRNKRGFLDRLDFNLKQYDIDFSEVRASESMEDFLESSSLQFTRWVFLSEQVGIVWERLRLSEEELGNARKRQQANLVDKADVIRAEDAVRIWKQNLVLAQSQQSAMQAELAVLVQDSRLQNLEPDFDLYAVSQQPPLEQATATLKDNSRLIRLLRIRSRQLELARQGFVETGRPDLSVVAQVNVKKLDDGLGNSMVLDKPDATIGLQFSYPLNNRTATHNVVRADLKIAQLREQIDQVVLELTSAYTGIYIQIAELEKVLRLNREQIESASERTNEELTLYNQGRGELTFVIQSRDNEQNAKLTYARNALNYQELLVRASGLMDELYR